MFDKTNHTHHYYRLFINNYGTSELDWRLLLTIKISLSFLQQRTTIKFTTFVLRLKSFISLVIVIVKYC